MRPLGVILLILCLSGAACAQVADQQEANCQTKLSTAENDFIAGKFYGIPSFLQECIDGAGYSNEEKVRVFMLLSQVYLLTDDPANAEASYLKLLAADPEYVANETGDPIDIVYLSKKFTTTPIFTPHFKVGPNLSTQAIVYDPNLDGTPDDDRTERKPLPGGSLGAGIEWNINDNLGIGGEAMFSYKSFRTSEFDQNGMNVVNVRERQLWVDFPFYVRYGYHTGKVRPYGYAGYAFNLLFSDRLNIVTEIHSGSAGSESSVEVQGPDPNVMYRRQWLTGSLVFGAGVKYKFGKNFLLAEMRYMGGLQNVVLEEWKDYADRFGDNDLWQLSEQLPTYAYVDPLFRVNNYLLSFGFVRPLYDPRKVAKARGTRGVSKKISKE